MTQLFLSHNDWLMSCHNNVDENVFMSFIGSCNFNSWGERERGGVKEGREGEGSKGREGGRVVWCIHLLCHLGTWLIVFSCYWCSGCGETHDLLCLYTLIPVYFFRCLITTYTYPPLPLPPSLPPPLPLSLSPSLPPSFPPSLRFPTAPAVSPFLHEV